MAIEEVVDVSVAGIGELGDLAGAFDKAAESAGKLKGELASLGGGAADSAGAARYADAWSDAASKVSESVGRIRADMAGLGNIGAAAGGAGLDGLVAKYDTAAADISASIGKIAESGAKLGDIGEEAAGAAAPVADLGDALKTAADSASILDGMGAGAADGIRGIGTAAGMSASDLLEFNAVMGETAAMQERLAKASAANAGDVAAAQRLSTAAAKDASDDAVASQAAQSRAAKSAAADAEASAGKYHMLALGGAAAIGYGIYKAAQLQTGVTRLYTSAGESQANLPLDSAGILKLSGETNTSQSQLAQGAYMINSAGYHGQDGLGVLKAAAEGAQAEGAPLGEVGNALTSLMNAYGPQKGKSASQTAMSDMDQIITMVGQGKMTMQGAVGALPAVLPAAAAAHLSFPQVAGSLATMTSMGMSPENAAQNLRHTIGSLQNPNTVQTGEMQQLGLNPVSIAKNLGKTGLTGTLDEIQAAVMKSMGPSGLVMLKTFNQSASAAQDATTMMKAMPPAIRTVAQSYLDGTISAKKYNAEVFSGPESAAQKNLLQQFATTANTAHGFNAALKSGQPDAQVYSAAMAKLLGGTVGLNTALMLTGSHASTVKGSVDAVASSAAHAGDNVKGWSAVQDTLNFKLGSFEKQAEAVATQAGQVVLPAVSSLMGGLSHVGGFLASNPGLTKPLVEGAGILGGVAVAGKVASAGTTALASVGKVAETLHIPGLDKLANLGQGSGLDGAAMGLKGSATDLGGAAADLSEAAGKLGTASVERGPGSPGIPAGTPERSAAQTAEADAEGGAEGGAGLLGIGALSKFFKGGAGMDGAGLREAVNPIVAGVAAGLLIRGEGDSLAPKGTPAGKLNSYLQRGNAPGLPAMNYETAGYESKLTMSSFGMDAGKIISRGLSQLSQMISSPFDAIAKSTHQQALPPAQQSQFQSRFGISEPGAAPARTAAAKISAPDTSSVDKARADTVRDMQQIDAAMKVGKPPKIPAPDMSALAGAKGKATSDANGITDAVKQAMHNPVKMPAPNISALAAARGPASADGRNLSAGFAQGIEAGKGAAVAAAEDVASAATAAMSTRLDSHSPSRVAEAIGETVPAGFTKGVKSGTAKVKESALTLSAATITSLTQGLQGGSSAIDAAMQAITGKGSRPQDITTIISTISTLKGDVSRALSDKQISKPEDSALTKMLRADNGKLQALATQRTVLEQKIADAQQIAQSAISGASIVNASAVTTADPAAAQSSASIIAGQQQQAQQSADFAKAVGQDKKMGLNATSLNQIVQSGASAGLPVAQGIAQGGKSAVTQLNKLQSEIQSSASKLAGEAAGPMYTAGVQAGQGFAQGLASQLGAVDAEIGKMAQSMISKIEKDLKIHSPSEVFADRGAMIPAGAAMGVDRGTGQAVAAVGRMGSRMSGAFHPGPMAYAGHGGSSGGGSGGGHGGGGDTHVTINMTVQGSVSSHQDLVNAVQRGLLRKGSNNWNTGIIKPGRGS